MSKIYEMKFEKVFLFSLMVFQAVFSFLFCLFYVDTALHLHFQQIAWQSDKLFVDYYFAFPGGAIEYFTLFLTQFFYSNILGSAIVAISGLLISFFVYKTVFLKFGKYYFFYWLILLMQMLFLVLMFDYRYHFSITVNLLFVSGFLFLNTLLERKFELSFPFHLILIGTVVYYCCGGMYFLVFMVSSLILQLKKRDTKMLFNALLIIVTIFLVPFLAYKFFFLSSLNSSYFRATPDVAAMLRYSRPLIFYIGLASIPTILLFVMIVDFFYSFLQNKQKRKRKPHKSMVENRLKIPDWNKTTKVAVFAQIGASLIISTLLVYILYKPSEKTKVEIDYYATQNNWGKVIELSEKIENYDRMVNFQYNRALLNTDQVLEKLFDYDQLLGSQGLFAEKPFTSEVTLPSSDLYFDLGNIDESLRFAFESETLMKNSPRVLKRLVLNCIIMNKLAAAKTYINILAANPMEKNWVEKYSTFIDNPNLVNYDSLFMKKRADMSKTEGLIGTPPLKLLSQLEKNPKNKAAFEYLIAVDLLEHDLSSLEADFRFINGLDYKKLPVVLEEAFILFRSQERNNEFLNNIRISQETTVRFREFAKLTSASKGDREKAKLSTVNFKNTYWYYVLFLSPKVTNLKLETRPVDANY